MKREDFTVLSSTDGLGIRGTLFYPDEIKGVLLMAHGMCEHKERYFSFMEYLVNRGIACGIYDHRGHGESVRREEDLGYFYRDGRKAVIEDLQNVVRFVKERFAVDDKGLQFFLLGHSMGSMVVRNYLKKYDEELDGLLVLGSPSGRRGVWLGKILVRALQVIKGSHSRSRLLDWMAVNSSYEVRFAKEKLAHAWICTDKQVVDAYNEDPKCNFTFTINGYKVLFYLISQTYNKRGFEVKKPNLPIQFLAGSEDPCIRNEGCFRKAVDNLHQVGYSCVKGKLFEGMRHEILNEKGKERVYEEIAAFLLGHIKQQ